MGDFILEKCGLLQGCNKPPSQVECLFLKGGGEH